ncbi:hypothetical protein ACCT07_02880 [Rhizobium johnstonii]|uniref:hypothetical protein n=1 Tax=Rhizobium johnstonii TaxID=3019933 RepID=UPI003F974555
MIQHLLVIQYRTMGATSDVLDINDKQAAERVAAFTIPGTDPAKADYFTDEMGKNILGMLKGAREMYGR